MTWVDGMRSRELDVDVLESRLGIEPRAGTPKLCGSRSDTACTRGMEFHAGISKLWYMMLEALRGYAEIAAWDGGFARVY